jgi:hypothetical protein
MRKIKFGILKGYSNSYVDYVKSCQYLKVDFEIIDILRYDWLTKIINSDCDGFLVRPPCGAQEQKNVYDDVVYFISEELKKPIYPEYNSLYLYENKRAMYYWLKINGFPHVKTYVIATKKEALEILDKLTFPVVFKANIGAGGKAVDIVKSKNRAKMIIHLVFGIYRPKFSFGYIRFGKIKGIPMPLFGMSQKHCVLIQDYKKIKWEWRIIKIGNSFFGHQKLLKGLKASGSGRNGWVKPPDELLYLTNKICIKGNFNSMAVDILEDIDGDYYVNELQSLFGSVLDSQMKINGIPGRFIFINDKFIFEEGEFNVFGSCLLRVKNFLEILNDK